MNEDKKKEVRAVIADLIMRVFSGSIPENVMSKTVDAIDRLYNPDQFEEETGESDI